MSRKRPDPRLARVERLLTTAMGLILEMKAGVPAPRRRRKKRRYSHKAILEALRSGAKFDPPGQRDPRLPCRTVLDKYRARSQAFDVEVGAVLNDRLMWANRGAVRTGPYEGATVRAERLPGKHHDWDEILRKIEGGATIGPNSPNRQGLPPHTMIMKRRKADPVFGQRVAAVLAGRFGRGKRIKFDRGEVIERIRSGAVITAHPPESGMPSKDKIDRERREDPSFDIAVIDAIREARRRKGNRTKLKHLPHDTAWLAAQGAVPRAMDADTRSDVIGELALRICSGEVGVDDDLQAAWKKCRTKITGPRWREVSLDAPVPGAPRLQRMDFLRADP